MKKYLLLCACAVALAPITTVAAHEGEPSAERLEADVRFLADDSLEGREAGTPGYDIAAGYIAGHFAAMGLSPSANGTYFQEIPMIEYTSTGNDNNTLTITGSDAIGELVVVEDYSASGTPRMSEGVIEGPLAFVGYGFAAEGYERDDFGDIDLTGKIAVVLSGAPTNLNTEEQAHFGSTIGQRISERGGVGIISLWSPEREKVYSWDRVKELLADDGISMSWVGEDGRPYSSAPNLKASAVVSPTVAEALFLEQPMSWEDIVAAEADPSREIKAFDMGLTGRIEFGNAIGTARTNNVIGVIKGSDSELANEVVVVTAHLDHVGMHSTEEEGDDEIFNGAMDNASGTAAIMEVARILVEEPPRRTVMFVALSAEEKGLRGSDYFARFPVLEEGQRLVANVNLDMPVVTYAFEDIVAFGAERSTMFPVVEKAAKAAGVVLSPDPSPHEGYFTRSDQYSFVKQGIPAIYLDTGQAGAGAEAFPAFLREHYHQESDEADLLDYTQLARFTALNVQVVRDVANMDETPKWKKGDFFGTTFGGPMEE